MTPYSLLKLQNDSRFFQIGSIFLALHDASDVFMEVAKVFKYFENELGATVIFGLFAISRVILQLIFFSFRVIKCTRDMFIYYMFNTMLLMLFVFQIYWWVLISSMIWRRLKSGKLREDIRSVFLDDIINIKRF
ncbi:LAG1 longevity assurance [Citrus sinensis]|uniref:LAG1 longevity assurance n=1 Tax=Citrus sinensis TaxID=2711 RepID=A0ACB8JDH7_CITSI|nr:LAG1 longevity assurance [Citrus sinensis]